jgi:hypothetical protein
VVRLRSFGLDAGFRRAADALERGYVDTVLRISLTAETCKLRNYRETALSA